jgi:S-adenosylmethionine synthetase
MSWTSVVISEGHPHYDRIVDRVMEKLHADEEYARRVVNIVLDELERAETEKGPR